MEIKSVVKAVQFEILPACWVDFLTEGNNYENFNSFVILWYLGNLKFLLGDSIIWFQRKFYLCYFIIKYRWIAGVFSSFQTWHLWRAILFFTCQDLQVVMATRFINLGVYFSWRLLFQVKTLARVKHNYLLRGRHLLLRELVTNFFATWRFFSERWSLNSYGIQCSLKAINVFRVRRYVINIFILR